MKNRDIIALALWAGSVMLATILLLRAFLTG